jgi:beta-lactamase class A
VDGSSYALDIADDSDSLVYERIGRRESLAWLAERMITHSSNLATNLLIQLVTPDSVNATLREIGAGEMRVLRGVEDAAAFRRGLNNTTTAYGLARALLAIARAERGETMPGLTRPGAERMAGILARQAFDQGIPAGLPAGTRVAHKTGWIEGIEHDGGIVYPPGRAPYVLVVLTSGFADSARANAEIARVAKGSWELWGEGR